MAWPDEVPLTSLPLPQGPVAGWPLLQPLTEEQRAWLEQHLAMGARTDLLHWLDELQTRQSLPDAVMTDLRQRVEQGDFSTLQRWIGATRDV